MEAKEGHGGSYAWKSILKGRSVFERGAKWRIGNGESIKIWGANWLPTVSHSGVHGPLKAEFQEAKVSSLIDSCSRSWDVNALASALSPMEVELVQKILLSRCQAEDTLYWPYVQSGQYTAKSGYFFLKSEQRSMQTTDNSPPIQPKPPWKQIWSLSLPSKIKNFLWRACRNALPTKENLVRRCVIADPTCQFCTTQAEDVLHAIWSCPLVSQVWDGDPQWQSQRGSTLPNFAHLLSNILESDCDTELFAMIAWTLWFRRNKSSFSPPGIPLEQVPQLAYNSLQEFRTANQTTWQQRPRHVARWSAPQEGSYKINFDGALFPSLNRAGVRVIIRDYNGLVMASLSQQIPLPLTALETETIAAARALEFALELGLNAVTLEGDCEILMKSLMKDSLSLASSGLLIQDVKVIAESFQCVNFSHVRREGNKVAHNLVRHACHVTGFSVWMEDVPSHTLVAYEADLPIS